MDGDTIIFDPGINNPFNVTYEYGDLNDIHLFIDGIDFGSVTGQSTINIAYSYYTDGYKSVSLVGYHKEGIVNVTKNLTFGKKIAIVDEIIDEDERFLGNQCYLILHDPNGDKSSSSFLESSTHSIGLGFDITAGMSAFVEMKAKPSLFGFGAEASGRLEFKADASLGWDCRYEIATQSGLTSSLIENDREYIGPGCGDIYWGEVWIIRYELYATHETYFNGTERWIDPQVYYGILRDVEATIGDDIAPQEWRDLNPVHNGYANVAWLENRTISSGGAWDYEESITSTLGTTITFNWMLSESATIKAGMWGYEVSTGITFSFGMGIYAETSQGHTITTNYHLQDTEGGDIITTEIGIDQRFGTYIFRPLGNFSQTSKPWEYNTRDYVPPNVSLPVIDYDTNDDGKFPCEDDA
nr:hypothetical protein [Candidatus Sigynarchaeota archaeon]